jgi:anti-sigma factor RsiW
VTNQGFQRDEDLIRRLDAALDGAAPELSSAEAATAAEWARQDLALRRLYGPVAAEGVPDRLAAIIGRAAAHGGGQAAGAARQRTLRPRRAGALAAAAAILAVGAALGYGAAHLRDRGREAGRPTLADAALLAHSTYAPEVVHPVEVGAGEAAHMTAWLSKRLGRGVVAPDFAAEGFRLIGGRVLPDANGPAAAMMYEDATGARVTIYIAPAPGQVETALRLASGHGTEGFWWADRGYGCAVVGEAPREVLKAMAGKAYQAIAG